VSVRELERQQALVAALWRDDAAVVAAWSGLVADGGRVPALRGLQAYRTNAGAVAERALASWFPAVRASIGADSFAGLARAFWQAEPPRRGDLGTLVAGLPRFIEGDARRAQAPYLADVARLEAALVTAEAAADAPGSATARLQSLGLLAEHEPRALFIDLAPGAAVIRSAWPIATIWRARHAQGQEAGGPELAREAITGQRGETVFVWRPEWAARLDVVDEATAAFIQALLDGRCVGDAHAAALERDPAWAFENWLAQAIEARWHAGARVAPAPGG
jgi:hypothetical protein